MKKYLPCYFLCFILLLAFATSCKESSNPTGPQETTKFSLDFKNGYIQQGSKYFVVLHSLDGKQVISSKEVTSDGIVDFGDIGTKQVTFTFVSITKYSKRLDTYFKAPTGKWFFNGFNDFMEPFMYELNIHTNGHHCDYYTVSTPSYMLGYSHDYEEIITHEDYCYFSENNKYSVFASISSDSTNETWCGWLLDQPIQNDSNYYNVTMNHLMESKNISFSFHMDNISLVSMKYNNGPMYFQSSSYPEPNETNVKIYYAKNFPAVKYGIYGSAEQDKERYSIQYHFSSLPSNINIPSDTKVSGDFNFASGKIEGISFSGNADVFVATFRDSTVKPKIVWECYTATNINELELPTLPQEITDELGTNYNKIYLNTLTLEEYNSFNGYNSYINKMFRTERGPFEMPFINYYKYELTK